MDEGIEQLVAEELLKWERGFWRERLLRLSAERERDALARALQEIGADCPIELESDRGEVLALLRGAQLIARDALAALPPPQEGEDAAS